MEFKKFEKIARLNRECIITEKIDGTNAQICIISQDTLDKYKRFGCPDGIYYPAYVDKKYQITEFIQNYCITEKDDLCVFAGSRTRWITPENDNYGFAKWVKENADELFKLGEGYYYGEWWGQGIQRKYNMDKKVFSLFNVGRWVDYDTPIEVGDKKENCPKCCRVVPILYKGGFDTNFIANELKRLKDYGSIASPGFMNPEGIVIYHTAARRLFKKTILNDEKPKSKVE